jgi:hypothetical protein
VNDGYEAAIGSGVWAWYCDLQVGFYRAGILDEARVLLVFFLLGGYLVLVVSFVYLSRFLDVLNSVEKHNSYFQKRHAGVSLNTAAK